MRVNLTFGYILIALLLLVNAVYLISRERAGPRVTNRTITASFFERPAETMTWTYVIPSSMRVGDTVAVPLQMSNQTFSTGAGDFAQIVVTASNDCTLTPERPTNQVFPRKGTSSLWGWKLKATGIGACSLNWRAILSRNRGVLVAAKRWDDTIAVTAPVFTRTYIRNIILALVIGAFLVIAAVVAAYLTRNRGDL